MVEGKGLISAGKMNRDGSRTILYSYIEHYENRIFIGFRFSLTFLHHFEMFPEDVTQERWRLGHESFASHIAQVSALPGVQRSVAARRRYQFVVRFVVVVQVLVRVIVVVVVVAAARRLAAAVAVAAAAETATAAADAFPDHLTAAAHDRGVGTGRGEFLELKCATHDASQ